MLINAFGAIAIISGNTVSFQPNFRISTQAFPVIPLSGVDQDPETDDYMGVYDQAAADNNFYYYAWSDNRDRNLANTRFNANIRFAKIPVTGP